MYGHRQGMYPARLQDQSGEHGLARFRDKGNPQKREVLWRHPDGEDLHSRPDHKKKAQELR